MARDADEHRHPVFASGGAVGQDLAAVDWAATPLGPPETWPQSLVTVVRAMLDSKFSMWMGWGPELTFFCNEAYRRDTLSSKYPWALGRPVREVWPEVWPDISDRVEAVLTEGVSTWDEALLLFLERSGYQEETYHTFSYSPLTDDDGAVAGLLCVVTEETERVISARRIHLVSSLGVALAAAATEKEVYAAAERALAETPRSLPFALLYRFDTDDPATPEAPTAATLVAATGIERGAPAAPTHVTSTTLDWPVDRVAAGEAVLVNDLAERFADVPRGEATSPPTQAYVLPLGRQGSRPTGFLVAALNRFRPFDDGYVAFLTLLASQLSASIATGRAHDEERARADAIAELDRAKTAFFTNVSHELRTPLTLLLGPAETLLDDGLAPEQRERVEIIHRNAERLLKLVNTLLDFSRLQSGRAAPRFERVDLARYTAELAAMFQHAIAEAGLALEVRCEPESLPAVVDQEMWAKIVLNLLSNALKFTFAGGITVQLRAVGHDGTQDVELAVADTGIGIEQPDQERLFERFHRVVGAESRSHEGTGIGLALVAELVAVHGGRVGVTSTPGSGTTFTVRIPALPPAAPAEVADAEPVPDVAQLARGYLDEATGWHREPLGPHVLAGAGDRARVLVVDDNADMRDYVRGVLADSYEVMTAEDGRAALDLARESLPDLVITDVMMPRLDGFGLLAALRDNALTQDVPVVMLSARSGEDAAVEGLEAGANDYLVKPFTARELLARVRANLELDRVRRLASELASSRGLLLQAQRLARVASWEVDPQTGEFFGSAEVFTELGLEPADDSTTITEAVDRYVHPDDRDRLARALKDGFSGRPFRVEWRLLTPSGVRHFSSVGELVPAAPGRPARLRGSMQDITQQREAEEELLAAVAIREASAREHRIADELQQSLLPQRTASPDGLDIATYYQAGVEGTQVGGDWYDVIPLPAGRAALVLGDVMGNGVRAATVMGQLRTTLRAYARLDLAPAEVLELLDNTVRELGDHQIATCAYCVWDPADRSLRYASAGHLPPVLLTPGEPAAFFPEPTSAPLGAGPLTIVEERFTLRPGQLLALYTDGLVEHRDQDLDTGMAVLRDRLAQYVEAADLDTVPALLARSLLPDGPDDDVTILLAKVGGDADVTGSRVVVLRRDRRAAREARTFSAEAMRGWQVPAGVLHDVQLAVSELVTNAVLHGAPPVELGLHYNGSRVRVTVTDSSQAAPATLEPEVTDTHGRGVRLVEAVADEWGVIDLPRGKTVWCSFRTDGAPAR